MAARRWPIGAELTKEGVQFRVWAPDQPRLQFVTQHGRHLMDRAADGYHMAFVSGMRAEETYQLELSDGKLIPDPASRFQPDGPHGPSQIIDPKSFAWTDIGWKGRALAEYVLYEMHIGTFTAEGTWAAAMRELPELAAAGITALEVMPVADFPGRFGWGYDGVCLFAPTRLYGSPDDFRRFVDAAHRHQLCVILDVVYNHLGPDGNYLHQLAKAYFTDRHATEWGQALNFDGEHSMAVREFFITNAAYWIDEFHLDGLRLDATQAIFNDSPPSRHILTEIGRAARKAGMDRQIVLIAENEPQHPELCRPLERGGHGLDGLWNDDFHHSANVAMTGRREAYYTDYRGEPQEFVSAAKYGYLYQGQWYSWQNQTRGHAGLDLSPENFITFIQNHDQIANSGQGLRIHELTSPGKYRTFLALTLLGPGIPLLFQGQEFASSSRFLFFADHHPELAELVAKGRREFLSQFPSLADRRAINLLMRPDDQRAVQQCILDFSERQTNGETYCLTKDLLRLRHKDEAFRPEHRKRVDGAAIGPQALVLRFFLRDGADRLLVVNWGHDLLLRSMPEPLIAPPGNEGWKVTLSTDSPQYGGPGFVDLSLNEGGWRVPSESACWLVSATQEALPSES